jgi:hypothetical protein
MFCKSSVRRPSWIPTVRHPSDPGSMVRIGGLAVGTTHEPTTHFYACHTYRSTGSTRCSTVVVRRYITGTNQIISWCMSWSSRRVGFGLSPIAPNHSTTPGPSFTPRNKRSNPDRLFLVGDDASHAVGHQDSAVKTPTIIVPLCVRVCVCPVCNPPFPTVGFVLFVE